MFDKFRSRGGVSWIVVFLGNPGPKYRDTRHNAGFMAADAMEKKLGVSINKLRFKALTAQATLGGEKVLLLKPQTYMNLSGESVSPAAAFYKVPPEHIIVVSDEVSLPIGKLRIRKSGSAGGHNGLKNIIAMLGTDAFPASAWVWVRRRTQITIWRIGCFRRLRTRTQTICALLPCVCAMPLSAISQKAPTVQ